MPRALKLFFMSAAIVFFFVSPFYGSDNEIPCNRTWDVLQAPTSEAEYGAIIKEAAELFADWNIHFVGAWLNRDTLLSLVPAGKGEPLLRSVRERMGLAVDLYDFLLFLDDVLLAGKNGYRGRHLWITAGRARKTGILLHPDDVFEQKPRLYGVTYKKINIEKPKRPQKLKPAPDGSLLGPRWTARFPNTYGEKNKLAQLRRVGSSDDFADRVSSLMRQLREQGVYVGLHSAVRSKKRGFLMWGAFALSRCKTKSQLMAFIEKLKRLNTEHELNIDIVWYHPDGWKATRDAARKMAETYDVVYATQRGALYSNHYDGTAVDITASGLPRKLTLLAPNGKKRSFDLSNPKQSRDLNLSPELIMWIEKNFAFRKLRSDYPHWDDAVQ